MRECALCKSRMAPYTPRKRVNGEMLCPACAKAPRGGMVSAEAAKKPKVDPETSKWDAVADQPFFDVPSDDTDGWFENGVAPAGHHPLTAPLPAALWENRDASRKLKGMPSVSRETRRSQRRAAKTPQHVIKRRRQALHKQAHEGPHLIPPVLQGHVWNPAAEAAHMQSHHSGHDVALHKHLHDNLAPDQGGGTPAHSHHPTFGNFPLESHHQNPIATPAGQHLIHEHGLHPADVQGSSNLDALHTEDHAALPANHSHEDTDAAGHDHAAYIPHPDLASVKSHLSLHHGMHPAVQGSNEAFLESHAMQHATAATDFGHHHHKESYLDTKAEEALVKAESYQPLPDSKEGIFAHLIQQHGADQHTLSNFSLLNGLESMQAVHNAHHEGDSHHTLDPDYSGHHATAQAWAQVHLGADGTADHNHELPEKVTLPGHADIDALQAHLDEAHVGVGSYTSSPLEKQKLHQQLHTGHGAATSHDHSEPDAVWQPGETGQHLMDAHGVQPHTVDWYQQHGPQGVDKYHDAIHDGDASLNNPSIAHGHDEHPSMASAADVSLTKDQGTGPYGGREPETYAHPVHVLPATTSKDDVIAHLNKHHPEVGVEEYDNSPFHTNGGGLKGWHDSLHNPDSSNPLPADGHEHSGPPEPKPKATIPIGIHLVEDHGLTKAQVSAMTPKQFNMLHEHDHSEHDEDELGHGHIHPGGPTREPRAAYPNIVHEPDHPNLPCAYEWYHGTTKHFSGGPDAATHVPNPNYGSDWNTHIGGHWSTLHQVAQQFGGSTRTIHGKLKMKNPIIYPSALHMAHDAYDRLRAAGEELDGGTHDGNHSGRGYGGCCSDVLSQYANGSPSVRSDGMKGLQKYRDSLRASGHDGIIYYNHADGPHGHPCAITFHPDDAEIAHDNCHGVHHEHSMDNHLWDPGQAPGEDNYVKADHLPTADEIAKVDRHHLKDEDVPRGSASPYYDNNYDGEDEEEYCHFCDVHGHSEQDPHCDSCEGYGHDESEHWEYCPACEETNSHGDDPGEYHQHCDYCEKDNDHGYGDHDTDEHEDEYGEKPDEFKDEDTCPHCGKTDKRLRNRTHCFPPGGSYWEGAQEDEGCGGKLPDWHEIKHGRDPGKGQLTLGGEHPIHDPETDPVNHLLFDHGVDTPGVVHNDEGEPIKAMSPTTHHQMLHNTSDNSPGHAHPGGKNLHQQPVVSGQGDLIGHILAHHNVNSSATSLAQMSPEQIETQHNAYHTSTTPYSVPKHGHSEEGTPPPSGMHDDEHPDDIGFHVKHFHSLGSAAHLLTPEEQQAYHDQVHTVGHGGFAYDTHHEHAPGGGTLMHDTALPYEHLVAKGKATDHLTEAHGAQYLEGQSLASLASTHLTAHQKEADHLHPTGEGHSQVEHNLFNHMVAEHGLDSIGLHSAITPNKLAEMHADSHLLHGVDGEIHGHTHLEDSVPKVKPEPAAGVNSALHSHLYAAHGLSPEDFEGETNTGLINLHKAAHTPGIPQVLKPAHAHEDVETDLLHTKKKSEFGKTYIPHVITPGSSSGLALHLINDHGENTGSDVKNKEVHAALHAEQQPAEHLKPHSHPVVDPDAPEPTDKSALVEHLNQHHEGHYSGDAPFDAYQHDHAKSHKWDNPHHTHGVKPPNQEMADHLVQMHGESPTDHEVLNNSDIVADHEWDHDHGVLGAVPHFHAEDGGHYGPVGEAHLLHSHGVDPADMPWSPSDKDKHHYELHAANQPHSHTHDDMKLPPSAGEAPVSKPEPKPSSQNPFTIPHTQTAGHLHLIQEHGYDANQLANMTGAEKQGAHAIEHAHNTANHEHWTDPTDHLLAQHGWTSADLEGKTPEELHHDHEHVHSPQWVKDNGHDFAPQHFHPAGGAAQFVGGAANLHADPEDLKKHIEQHHWGQPVTNALVQHENLIKNHIAQHQHADTASGDTDKYPIHHHVHPDLPPSGAKEAMKRKVVQERRARNARSAQKTQVWLHHESGIKVVAHDSGDGETLYHCPFCGSGQVIARSDGTTECEFCHTMFTVQVQPEFNAFPQTINGMPVDVPGMPGEIDSGADAMMGEDPTAPADPADVAEDGSVGGGSGFSGKPSADNQPPWLASKAQYVTAAGKVLDEDDFVAHLALATADPALKKVVATQVKKARNS